MRIILNLSMNTIQTQPQIPHLTKPRRQVLQIIHDSQSHLDAQEIWERARQKKLKISLATVYRTVRVLEQAGLISEHNLGQDHCHYEATSEDSHYHFTCLMCGKVLEFSTPQPQSMARKLNELHGIHIQKIHLLMEGICKECATSKNGRPSKKTGDNDGY